MFTAREFGQRLQQAQLTAYVLRQKTATLSPYAFGRILAARTQTEKSAALSHVAQVAQPAAQQIFRGFAPAAQQTTQLALRQAPSAVSAVARPAASLASRIRPAGLKNFIMNRVVKPGAIGLGLVAGLGASLPGQAAPPAESGKPAVVFTNQHAQNGGQPQFAQTADFQHIQSPQMPSAQYNAPEVTHFGAHQWIRQNYDLGEGSNRGQFYKDIDRHLAQQPGAHAAYTQALQNEVDTRMRNVFTNVPADQLANARAAYWDDANNRARNDDAPNIGETLPGDLGDVSAANAAKTRTKIPVSTQESSGPLTNAGYSQRGTVVVPKGQEYLGQGALKHVGGTDAFEWGRAFPRQLVQLHELGHAGQIAATDAEENNLVNSNLSGDMATTVAGIAPSQALNEPAAVLGEQVHAINAATKATGTTPDVNVRFSPNYAPSARWMADQARRHGFTTGHREMQDLLNTPEGQAWLANQHRDFYAAEQLQRQPQ